MRTFESSVEIAAPPGELFALSQDYDRRLDWDPFLCEARLVGGAKEVAVGVRAWCVSRFPKLGMETEYVSYKPPTVTAVKMTKGPWFIRSFAGSWRFEPLSDRATRVVFRYSVDARPRWLGFLFRGVFARDVVKRLDALKSFVEKR
jgi:ribosome-associated toxin RatA of RatAB toxin-antitoxin module